MHSLPAIERNPTSSVYSWLRGADPDLALELEHAEFAERAPALQPRGFVDPLSHIMSAVHGDTRAADYFDAWQGKEAEHKTPVLDASHPRKHIATARHRFLMLFRSCDRSRGLRQLMDAYFHSMMAFTDLKSLQRQAKRTREANKVKRQAEREADNAAFGAALAKACRKVVGVTRHG
jgi:hypothetical protein